MKVAERSGVKVCAHTLILGVWLALSPSLVLGTGRSGGELSIRSPKITTPNPNEVPGGAVRRPKTGTSTETDTSAQVPEPPKPDPAPPMEVAKPASVQKPPGLAAYSPPKLLEAVVDWGVQATTAAYELMGRALGFRSAGRLSPMAVGLFWLLAMGFFGLVVWAFWNFYWWPLKEAQQKAALLKISHKQMSFDPSSKLYRVLLQSIFTQKVAIIEISDIDSKVLLDAKELVEGSVLPSQYLPTETRTALNLQNGLVPVKYLAEWTFQRTSEPVQILVRDIRKIPDPNDGGSFNTNPEIKVSADPSSAAKTEGEAPPVPEVSQTDITPVTPSPSPDVAAETLSESDSTQTGTGTLPKKAS